MAATDIIQKVRSHVYGSGVGEKPTIVLGASNASETVTAPTIEFSVGSGEGGKIEIGDVLSVMFAASESAAYVLYVMNVSTDTVTALMGYMGSPSPTAANALDDAVFELNPLKSEFMIWNKMETVFDTLLYPQVYKPSTQKVTPDLSDYQVELPATVEKIQDAKQQVGGEWFSIPFSIQADVHTDISSTGVLGELWAIDGSDVRLLTHERYTSSDTISTALEECVATGTAALVLGASRSSTDLEAASKDSQFRGQRNPADQLWRDFITLRAALTDDLASQVDWFVYRRG